jgi:hypothetical protein
MFLHFLCLQVIFISSEAQLRLEGWASRLSSSFELLYTSSSSVFSHFEPGLNKLRVPELLFFIIYQYINIFIICFSSLLQFYN